jgi:hypothetical protein
MKPPNVDAVAPGGGFDKVALVFGYVEDHSGHELAQRHHRWRADLR